MANDDNFCFVLALVSFNIVHQLAVNIFPCIGKAEMNNILFLIACIAFAVIANALNAIRVKIRKPLLCIRADKAGENQVIGFAAERELSLRNKIIHLVALCARVDLKIGKAEPAESLAQIRLCIKIACCARFIGNKCVIADYRKLR